MLIQATMAKFITIAIDGVAASGKTSTALRVAEKYNFLAVSTGLHYRAIALVMFRNGVGSDDGVAVAKFLLSTTLETKIIGNSSHMVIDGKFFEDYELRTREVNDIVSQYSAVAEIRKFLFNYQRDQRNVALANSFNGIVEEGRDITSVIFPDADLKFFLEASVVERRSRRKNDSESDCVAERDEIDNARTICGADVLRINTESNDLSHVVAIISDEIGKLLSDKRR
jgi:cytidylate kinase